MNSWRNGALGGTVKKVIDDNFLELEKRANHLENKTKVIDGNLLELEKSTSQLENETNIIKDSLLELEKETKVIDDNFLELEKRTSQLEKDASIPAEDVSVYVEYIKPTAWEDGIIQIDYAKYNKQNPRVDLYIKQDSGYEIVFGGYVIEGDNIKLCSDIAYEGKVVIR